MKHLGISSNISKMYQVVLGEKWVKKNKICS